MRRPAAVRPGHGVRFGAPSDELGSGTVAGLMIAVAICVVMLGMLPLGGALAERQRLEGAADTAALAAADTASGRVSGIPCDLAAQIAAEAGASVMACAVDPAGVARVTLTTTVLGIAVDAMARAGPPRGPG